MKLLLVIILGAAICIATNDQPFNFANSPRWESGVWLESPDAQSALIQDLIKNQQKINRNRIQQPIIVQPDEGITFEEYLTNPEFDSSLPYGIQNVRDVSSRSSHLKPVPRKLKTTFQSLCPSKRSHVYLNLESDYEYRPDHYEEVECLHAYTSAMDYNSVNNKVCGQGGFTCIQLNRTIFLTRKARGSDCWETEARLVAAGCECMWPQHKFGDIAAHH
ncbi:unnamed protein product [Hermetia illucens]|uniref:Uncharacterized protein n=1 Tax=Hermetia illucens TaxID=343691 RepID=A0A7R8Z1D1_HERIL|nr:uncharacterized protein LOC119660474 [Hermetia illucens]CAD7091788.1 unnamed protein product [Hermetia illucens]